MSELTVTSTGHLAPPSLPDRLYLGRMEPEPADVAGLVEATQEAVKRRTEGYGHEEAVRVYQQFYPLTLEQYVRFAGEFKTLERELRANGRVVSVKHSAPLLGLLELRARPEFTPDFKGYVAYLRARNPALQQRIDNLGRPSALPEEGRREHTLIVAPVNWGKSELLKALAYHYAQHPDLAAVVVLDPGGDMAKQIARWPELVQRDRVVLIEPGLQKGKTVGLNPLDGAGLDEDERSIVATFWAQQIGALTAETSAQMERVARHCVHILLAYPSGATFNDLLLLLGARDKGENTPRQKALLEFGKRYKNPRIAGFSATTSKPRRSSRRGARSRTGSIGFCRSPTPKRCSAGRPTSDSRTRSTRANSSS